MCLPLDSHANSNTNDDAIKEKRRIKGTCGVVFPRSYFTAGDVETA